MLSTHFITAAMRQKFRIHSVSAISLLVYSKWLLIALLIIPLAHSMTRLFWLLMPEPVLTPMTETPVQGEVEESSDTRQPVDIDALKALALFGEPPKTKEQPVKAAPIPVKEAKETVLNVKLNGVFVSNDNTRAHAIISQGKQQSLYRVGEELDNLRGVTLVNVLSDRVIIDNNGKDEAILLYPEDEETGNISATHYEDTLEKEPTFQGAVSQLATEQAAGQKVQRLTDIIKISMARENGTVLGLRVRPGRNRQIFDNLGLKTNDIVTAVNGTELTSAEVAMETYRSMRAATAASLQVKRGDQELNLDIDLTTLEQ